MRKMNEVGWDFAITKDFTNESKDQTSKQSLEEVLNLTVFN